MIIDKALLFSDAQAITAAAASTDYADLGSARDLGLGENLYVAVTVDVAFTDAGSDSTLAVALESDDNTGFATPVSTTLFTIPALAAIGAKFYARISPEAANQRYIRLYYTPANGNLTTGSVTAAIVTDIDKQVNYPKGYTIS
jgi:hypothetical protein